jgi:hypothetical protein
VTESDKRDGESSADWVKLAGEKGKYRMMKWEKDARRCRELDLRLCLVWRQSFLFSFVKQEKKNHILNYSETQRRKTLSVSSPGGVKLPHSHGMAADENKKVFFGLPRCCGP